MPHGSRLAAAWLALALLGVPACSDDAEPPSANGDGAGSPDVEIARGAPLPEARTEVAGAAWDGRLVVVGGLRADGRASDRVDLYDVEADAWAPGPALPVALHHTGLAAVGDRLWVVGGYSGPPDAPWVEQAGVFSLGPEEQGWRAEPELPRRTGALAVAAVDDTLVAFGGVRDGRQATETWVLTPGADGWDVGPPLRQAREHLGASVLDGRVYAIAGRVGGLETNLTSVESWRPGEDAWRSEPELRAARGGIAAAVVASVLCVAGGEEPGGTIASVECLDDGRWDVVTRLRSARHGLAVIGVGDRLHVIGGGREPGLFVSDDHEVLRFSAG